MNSLPLFLSLMTLPLSIVPFFYSNMLKSRYYSSLSGYMVNVEIPVVESVDTNVGIMSDFRETTALTSRE